VLTALSQGMAKDGYLQLAPVFEPAELAPIIAAIHALNRLRLPPVYIYMFDQPWSLFRRLGPLIRHFLGDRHFLLPNFWAWHIPARAGACGWPVHRDNDGVTRFTDPDSGQTLMSLSLWLPLTDATIDNGCMHVLPRSRQAAIDTQTGDRGLINQEQGLALPARAGAVLGWAQDLYHWSGTATARAGSPRISLSLEFQNAGFAPMATPLLDIAAPPEFSERLALISGQIAKYRHMEDPGAPLGP